MDETKILMCEICREPIARFNPEEIGFVDMGSVTADGISAPIALKKINLQAFKSLYPERQVPNPFPAALDDWRAAACPRCRRRPFFNFFSKGDGTVIVASGDPVQEGQQWFVMVMGDSGLPEKMLLSDIKPEVPPELPIEQPPQEHTESSGSYYMGSEQGEEPEPAGDEPTGNYKSLPVACPHCGKQFRSKGRLDKYHTPCPNLLKADLSLPPQEGFKL